MNPKYYLLLLLAVVLACVSCSDDLEQERHPAAFCVRAEWQNGRGEADTRTSVSLLAPGNSASIEIAKSDYPQSIDIKGSDGSTFRLISDAPASSGCSQHPSFVNYTSDLDEEKKYTIDDIKNKKLTFTASCTINDGDVLEGAASYTDIHDDHVQFTLHHKKALLRFAFKVDEKYDQIRYIKVTGIKLDDTPCAIVENVLNANQLQLIAYSYIDPTATAGSTSHTLKCTYDIYDKDADFTTVGTDNSSHLTRQGVTATNQFQLNRIVFGSSVPAKDLKITAGYYYDLNITLNPDYLYVLSEHDNKHITIE